MATIKDLAEQYGVAKAQDQNENLGRLAEMLGSARDIGNEYKVPSWVPLAGGTGAGDLLMGAAPEEIENWSYGNAPMQIPEMSNVPQFKRGRAQSLADALTTLAPGVKATEGLPAGLSFIGPKSRNWDKVAVELAAKKLDEGADPLSKYKDYVGEHSAPLGDSGAPLHNLTANENAIYPRGLDGALHYRPSHQHLHSHHSSLSRPPGRALLLPPALACAGGRVPPQHHSRQRNEGVDCHSTGTQSAAAPRSKYETRQAVSGALVQPPGPAAQEGQLVP